MIETAANSFCEIFFSGVHPGNRCVQVTSLPDVPCEAEDGRPIAVSDLIDSWSFRADSDEAPHFIHLR